MALTYIETAKIRCLSNTIANLFILLGFYKMQGFRAIV